MTHPTKKNSFLANTLRLIFGNAGAQAINLITIPIITRLYSPESYGILTLFLSVSELIIAVSCLRLETAILLPEKKEDAFNVLFLCLFFVFIFTLLVAVFALVVKYTQLQLPESYNTLVTYLYLMSGYIFLAGTYKALSFFTIRQNNFNIQALARVSNAGVSKLFSVLYGVFLLGNPIGLIGGLIVGHLISCWLIIRYSLKKFFTYLRTVDVKLLIRIFKRYKSFAIYSGTALLEVFSKEIVFLTLGIVFGPSIVGLVGLTKRVFQQPIGILGSAISRSFFQKIAEIHRSSKQYNTYVFDLFNYLLITTFIPVLLFSIISPEIFEIIFGAEWRAAGSYFSMLSISFLSLFLYRPISIIFDIQEKQRLRFILTLLRLTINIIAICFGAYFMDKPIYAIISYSVANTMFTFGMMFFLMHKAGVAYLSLFAVVIKQILIGTLFMLPLLYIKHYTTLSDMVIFCIIGFCFMGYFFYVFMSEPKLKRKLQNAYQFGK